MNYNLFNLSLHSSKIKLVLNFIYCQSHIDLPFFYKTLILTQRNMFYPITSENIIKLLFKVIPVLCRSII